MPSDLAVVLGLSASIVAFAAIRGGGPERYGAAILAAGILVDRAYALLISDRDFVQFAASRLVFDLLQMVGYLGVALLANRVWTLWLAAAQLVAISGSLSMLLMPNGNSYAYWALTQLPLFVQLTALAIGTLLHQRRLGRLGLYNSWSPRTG